MDRAQQLIITFTEELEPRNSDHNPFFQEYHLE
jgi:hypothetical protein